MNLMRVFRIALRVLAAVGVVGATTFAAAPLDAHHSVNFDSYNCSTPTPTPGEEPDVSPLPEPPEGPDEGSPTPSPQSCMPVPGDRIVGTRMLAFSSSTDGARPIMRVALAIHSQDPAIPHANQGEPLLEETYTRERSIRSYGTPCEEGDDRCTGGPFAWDSRGVTPYNGAYQVRVDVDTYPAITGNEPHNAFQVRENLRVDNPPLAVGAPKVIAKTITSITVQWPAAVEPDVTAYTLYRAVTDKNAKPSAGALKPIAITTGVAFRDDEISPGFHWYAVKVTRRSIVTPEAGISSPLSAVSGAAEIKPPVEGDEGEPVIREIPDFRKPQLVPRSRLASVPDAPFTYQLPVGDAPPGGEAGFRSGTEEAPFTDPRGPVLPVAVGMFLVSSALAVGRMPY